MLPFARPKTSPVKTFCRMRRMPKRFATGSSIWHGDQAERFGWTTNNYAMLLSGVVGLGFIFFAEWVVLLYTSDPDVIRLSSVALQVIGFTQVFQSAQYVLSGALRGAGDTKFNMQVALWGVIIFRIIVTGIFIFVFHWGLFGAWLALALDQIFRSSLFAFRFRQGRWKSIRV
jgi:Na+-driven multidrug efflux pump